MITVRGKNLYTLLGILENVGSCSDVERKIRIARMIRNVKLAIEEYDYARRPGDEYEEYMCKMRGIAARYGEKGPNGIMVPGKLIDDYNDAVSDVKETYAETIAREYDRQRDLHALEDRPWSLNIDHDVLEPSWVVNCDASQLSLLLDIGLVSEDALLHYGEHGAY